MTLVSTLATAVVASPPSPVLLEAAQKLGLVLARTAGLFSLSPLAQELVPGRVRAGMAVIIALVLLPGAPAPAPGHYPLQLCAEAAVGLAAALLSRLPVLAIEAGLQVTSVSAGLGIASLLNPGSDEEVHALTEILLYGALVLFFAGGGHHLLLLALHESLQQVPPGAARLHPDTLGLVLRLGSDLFATTIMVAAPVMLVAFGLNLALALVSRAAPAVNVFSVSLVAVLLVGLWTTVQGLPQWAAIGRRALAAIAPHFLLGFR